MVEYFFIYKLSAAASQLYVAVVVRTLPVLWLKNCSWGLCLHDLPRNMGAQSASLLARQAELPVLTATAAAKPICHLEQALLSQPLEACSRTLLI